MLLSMLLFCNFRHTIYFISKMLISHSKHFMSRLFMIMCDNEKLYPNSFSSFVRFVSIKVGGGKIGISDQIL